MSLRRLPRRSLVPFCAALLGLAAPAWAQLDTSPTARTLVSGAAAATACARAAAASDASDEAMRACDAANADRSLAASDRFPNLVNRGALHMHRHEAALALADFDAAAAIDRRNGEAQLNRGAALIMNGQPGLAVAAFTQALTLGVRYPHKAYYNRAAAREQLGDLRGAFEDYSTALQIEPDWGPAEAELARFVRTRRESLASALNDAPANPANPAAPSTATH